MLLDNCVAPQLKGTAINKWKFALPVVLLTAAITLPATALPASQELLDKMLAAVAAMQSLEVDASFTNWDQANSSSGLLQAHFAMDTSAKDGKTIRREFLTAKITKTKRDGKVEVFQEHKIIDDGTFQWWEQRGLDTKGLLTVSKQIAKSFDWADQIARDTKEDWKLYGPKVVGEDLIHGQKMYVLEGAAPQDGTEKKSMRLWVGQDDLFVHRRIATDQRENEPEPNTDTREFLNLKVNWKIDPALFTYTPPEGATVTDDTKH